MEKVQIQTVKIKPIKIQILALSSIDPFTKKTNNFLVKLNKRYPKVLSLS